MSSQAVLGEKVVAGVPTQVKVSYDGKNKAYTATQNTVRGALEQAGISLQQNDISVPPLDSNINGGSIEVEVVRALPVLISDNNQEHLAYSAYTNETEILKQLNIETYPEDRVESSLILDPADENSVGQKVTIERAPVFTIHVDDNDMVIRSWGKNVGEVLKEKVTLGQKDVIEPAIETDASNVQEITVTRVNVIEVDESLVIPHETENRKDYTIYKGEVKVIQQGQNGQKTQHVKVVYHNGLIVNRIILSSTVTKTTTTKIIAEGVKPYNAGTWWNTLVAAGNTWGVDPLGLYNVMICESGGNPYSGVFYKGLFQYNPDTWVGASSAYPGGTYRGAAITNGTAQIYVTAWKVSRSGWSAWGCKP